MDGVRAFSIPADDMQRASRFYRSVFDWEIEPIPGSQGDFHSAQTTEVDSAGDPSAPGAVNGGLFRRGTHHVDGVMLEVKVRSIDASIEKVLSNGGKLILPKRPVLDFAYLAIVEDTEGNALGLWEER